MLFIKMVFNSEVAMVIIFIQSDIIKIALTNYSKGEKLCPLLNMEA